MMTVRFDGSTLARALAALALIASVGCSSSDDGKGPSPSPSSSSTSSSQTCRTPYGCIGGSCTCSDGPSKDKSCCEPGSSGCDSNACDSVCKYCE